MNEIQKNIIREISNQYRKMGFLAESNEAKKLPLFLSGGVDSTLCGLVAHSLGLKPVCISFKRKNLHSEDYEQGVKTCKIMGWEHHGVVLPTESPKDAFFRMVNVYGCKKKTEIECLYPFTFMLEKVRELGFKKVVYGSITTGDSRKRNEELRYSPQQFWARVVNTNTVSSASKKIIQVYKDNGVTVCCPMQGKRFKSLFVGLTVTDINPPKKFKGVYKDCFPTEFAELGMTKIRSIGLQKGGQIFEFFESLADNPEVNPIQKNGAKKYASFNQGLVNFHWKKIKNHTVENKAHRRWVDNATDNPKMNYRQAIREIYYQPYTMDDVRQASDKKLFTVVSTFAGGGGSSTGYRLAGGNVLGINEFIEEACVTYKVNYPDAFVDNSDVRKITGTKKEGVLKWFEFFGVKQGELDILDGSPPCATFSKAAGRRLEAREKHEELDKNYSETSQDRVGMLIHDYVYLANIIQPKICVLENVPEIKHSSVFKDALKRLQGSGDEGYLVNFKVLNATNFGVPQSRQRTFVIAVRKDVAAHVGIQNKIDLLSLFPSGNSYAPTVRDALETLELNGQDLQEIALIKQHIRKSATYEIIRALKKNPEKWWRLQEEDKGFKNYYFNLKRCAWGLPAPTIAQSSNQLGARGGILHPEEDRTYTVREMKRLFALPDDFKLTGTFNQRQERIGRMVCPPMTKAIGDSLFEKVLSKYSDRNNTVQSV